MKIKLPKRFYTVEQLAERWECKVEDIYHLIEIAELETVDKGAARNGKKHLRPRIFYDWDSYEALEHDEEFSAELTIPIINLPDVEVSDEEILKNEMESLIDTGEFDQVISIEEVIRFEEEHSEPEEPDTQPHVEPQRPRSAFPTTRAMVNAFHGLNGWSRQQWNDALSDPPKWMKPHLIPGGGPPQPNRWHPVGLARVLMSKNKTDVVELNKRFKTTECLQLWLPDWQPFAELIENE